MDQKLKLAGLVLGGYVLGRTRKGKAALMLAAAVAGKQLRANPDQVTAVRDSVLASPGVRRLTGEATGRLADAGKAAAAAAVTRRVESLSANLRARTEQLSGQAAEDEDQEDQDRSEVGAEEPDEEQTPAEDEQAEDEPAEDEPAEDEPAEDEPAAEKTGKGSSSRSKGSSSGGRGTSSGGTQKKTSGTTKKSSSSRSGSSGTRSKQSGSRSRS
ncbi:hypothetical protein [Georgenia alba]|uniref:DNA primase n=1 Tax=Georgenia alba TaxID=2233858 RepID=A0ABW2Q466_9MICO